MSEGGAVAARCAGLFACAEAGAPELRPFDEAYTVAAAGSPSVIGEGLTPLTMR